MLLQGEKTPHPFLVACKSELSTQTCKRLMKTNHERTGCTTENFCWVDKLHIVVSGTNSNYGMNIMKEWSDNISYYACKLLESGRVEM